VTYGFPSFATIGGNIEILAGTASNSPGDLPFLFLLANNTSKQVRGNNQVRLSMKPSTPRSTTQSTQLGYVGIEWPVPDCILDVSLEG
jgi:hypothetical protein